MFEKRDNAIGIPGAVVKGSHRNMIFRKKITVYTYRLTEIEFALILYDNRKLRGGKVCLGR